MQAGIFGRPTQETEAAIAEGLRALGLAVEFQRPGVWTPDQARPYGVVVVRGLRLQSGDIARHYEALGVPVLVHDLPALRKDGYFALWPGGINRLPETASEDRLGMVEFRDHEGGDDLIVCGQKANDQAHGLTAQGVVDYFGALTVTLRKQYPDKRVVWRPHPQERIDFYWAHRQNPEDVPLDEALDSAFAVATFNSTCGVTALARGVPVLCSPESFYAPLSGIPMPAGRREFFARLSYTQWTLEELATPEPYLFNLPAELAA